MWAETRNQPGSKNSKFLNVTQVTFKDTNSSYIKLVTEFFQSCLRNHWKKSKKDYYMITYKLYKDHSTRECQNVY